jgi:hypothetical protein
MRVGCLAFWSKIPRRSPWKPDGLTRMRRHGLQMPIHELDHAAAREWDHLLFRTLEAQSIANSITSLGTELDAGDVAIVEVSAGTCMTCRHIVTSDTHVLLIATNADLLWRKGSEGTANTVQATRVHIYIYIYIYICIYGLGKSWTNSRRLEINVAVKTVWYVACSHCVHACGILCLCYFQWLQEWNTLWM